MFETSDQITVQKLYLLLIYRDLALKMGGLGTQIGSNGEKRTKTSPIGK